MPLFYFDIVEADGSFSEDDTGTELPSVDAARSEAAHLLGGILYDLRVSEGTLRTCVRGAVRRELFTTTLTVQRGEPV
jgi:hypothetical protein